MTRINVKLRRKDKKSLTENLSYGDVLADKIREAIEAATDGEITPADAGDIGRYATQETSVWVSDELKDKVDESKGPESRREYIGRAVAAYTEEIDE